MDIDGNVALVTGGASGLGEATARHLHRLGAHVVDEIDEAFQHYWKVGCVDEDWAAWTELFTPDVVYVEHLWGRLHGREEVRRALAPTSYNRAIRGALNGKIPEYVSYPVPWVFAEDVAAASIAAARHGKAGSKYLAFGVEDAQSTAAWLNVACEAAGVPHRVEDVIIDPDDPEMVARYGDTLVTLAQRRFPVPWFDNSRSRAELGYTPRPLREAMEITCDWLRREGQIRD